MNRTVTSELLDLFAITNRPENKDTTLIMTMFNDMSFDLELYHIEPGYVDEHNHKNRKVKFIHGSSYWFLAGAIKELLKQKWSNVIWQSPQDSRAEKAQLRKRIKKLEKEIENNVK